MNDDLAAELWDELAEARIFFPPAGELVAKGGLYISRDRAERAKSRIAPLVRRLNSDEARTALGEARQFAALGECFVYLYWVSQVVGAPSATFRNYAGHYLSSAIPLLEERTGGGPRGAAKGRAQARQPDVEALRSLLKAGLDMPVLTMPPMLPEVPSTPARNAGAKAPAPLAHPPAAPPAQDTRDNTETLIRIEKLDAEPAPATPSPPKTNRACVRGRSGAGRRPRRTGRPPLGITLGKYILALIGAVITGAVVAVAVLAAPRMNALLSEWSKMGWDFVLCFILMGGMLGFLLMASYSEDGFKVFGVRRYDKRFKKDVLLIWVVSVIVSVIGVACASVKPDVMRLVDSDVTEIAALMSEQFGRIMSEGSAATLSAATICAVVGVIFGAAISFVFGFIIFLSKLSHHKNLE